MDEYPPPDDRWIRIGRNTYSLPWSKMTKEERAEDNRIYGAFFNGVLTSNELENIRKVFALYVSFPKSRWAEIKKSETNPILYNKLMREFKDKHLLDRKNRHNAPGSLHENIDARELFINDPESVVV